MQSNFVRFVLSTLLLSLALRAGAQGPPAGGAVPPPQEITFVTAEEQVAPLTFTVVGAVEASASVEVRARLRGFLQSRKFVEGAFVNENDLLYQIDTREFAIAVEMAEAGVLEAEAELKQTEAKLKQARSRQELAQTEFDRMKALLNDRAVAQGDFDKAQEKLESAQADVANGEADIARAAATLRHSQAAVENARLDLSYTEVRAPISGVVGKTLREVGSLVDDNDRGLLTRITRLTPIYVTLSVSERDFLSWRKRGATGEIALHDGEKENVELLLSDGSVHDERGAITFEDPTLDTSTGTFRIRAEFPNAKGLLKPGQFVRARINGWERPKSITVPQRAVNQMPTGAYVYVVGEGDTVEFRPVKTGEWSGSDWVILSGLKPGDRVLVEGFMKVKPGAKVHPVPYIPGAAPAAAPDAAKPADASKPAEASKPAAH